MRTAHTILFDYFVEIREGELSQTVLVNGEPVSTKAFAALTGGSHYFTLTDKDGTAHNLEVRSHGQGMLKTDVTILCDGRPSVFLHLVKDKPATSRDPRCLACGYSLQGLAVVNDEIRCPECGRHTAIKLLGFASQEAYERWCSRPDDDSSDADASTANP